MYPGLTLCVVQNLGVDIMYKGRPEGAWYASQLKEPGTMESRVGGEGKDWSSHTSLSRSRIGTQGSSDAQSNPLHYIPQPWMWDWWGKTQRSRKTHPRYVYLKPGPQCAQHWAVT